ncbi:MAG: DUF5677 domain-containing protein [Blastocatellia bacterium]
MSVGFGLPDQWEMFEKKFPKFLKVLPSLNKTIEKVVGRKGKTNDLAESVIFFLGRLCAEDFSEIVLMCGNGYGFGAMRLLRSMYERCVTLAYLAKNPNEASAFWDYLRVTQRKILNQLKTTVGEADVIKSLGKKTMNRSSVSSRR